MLKFNTLASLCLLKEKLTQDLESGILTRPNLKAHLVTTQLNKLTLHQQNIIFHSQRNVVTPTITCIVIELNLACVSSCRYVLRRISIKSSNRAERSNNEIFCFKGNLKLSSQQIFPGPDFNSPLLTVLRCSYSCSSY